MKKRLINLLGLFILFVFCIAVGFLAKNFMKVDNLSKVGIDITYQYLIFSALFSMMFAISHCLNGIKTSLAVFLFAILSIILLTFQSEQSNKHLIFFLPLTIFPTALIFYFSWIKPFLRMMKALQFALLSALIYSYVIYLTFRIFGNGMRSSDFFIFLLDSFGFFVAISVGLSFGTIIFAWIRLKMLGEPKSIEEDKDFIEV